MKYVLENLEVQLHQRAVVAIAAITIPTRQQGTNVVATLEANGATTLSALFNLWKAIRVTVASVQSKPGTFELKTSDFRRGLFGTRAI